MGLLVENKRPGTPVFQEVSCPGGERDWKAIEVPSYRQWRRIHVNGVQRVLCKAWYKARDIGTPQHNGVAERMKLERH